MSTKYDKKCAAVTCTLNNSHAVASSQIPMDDVFAAQILHPSSNIQHELDKSLLRQSLQKQQTTSDIYSICVFDEVTGNKHTKGSSPRRDMRRNVWRSPCFMKGRITIGTGSRCWALLCRLTPAGVKSQPYVKANRL